MCPFHAAAFPNCIVTVSRDDLSIGAIDDIQKLHVRTVPLGEQPRRIAYDAATGTLCLGTVTEVPVVRPGADGASGSGQGAADATGAVREVSRVHLLAAGTFERLFSMDLLREQREALRRGWTDCCMSRRLQSRSSPRLPVARAAVL